jgi:hypothetical protein
MQTISAGLTSLLAGSARAGLAQKVTMDLSRNTTCAAPGIVIGDDVGSPTFGYNTYLYSGWEQGFQYCQADGQASADGTFYPCEGSVNRDHEYNHGWWSAQKSESDGVFRGVAYDPYAVLDYVYSGARKGNVLYFESSAHLPYISKIKVYLDEGSGYDAGTEYDLTTWYLEIDLGEVKTLDKVKVVAMETSEGEQPARFYQIDLIWRVTFDDDDIQDMIVNKRIEHLVTTRLPYGAFAASQLDLTILDDDDNFKGSGQYAAFMVPNVKIVAWFGALVGASYQWVQQGVFYTEDTWSFTPGLDVRVTARDRMKHLQEIAMDDCDLFRMKGAELFKNLIHRAHIRPGLISSEAFVTSYEYAGIYGGTIFDAMTELAKSIQAIFFFDELGTLHIHNSSHAYGSSIATLTDSDWLEDPKVTEPERANQVTVNYQRYKLAYKQTVHELSEFDTSVANGASKTIVGEFNKSPVRKVTGVSATGSASLTDDTENEVDFTVSRITHDGFKFKLVVTNNSGAAAYLTDVLIYGYPISAIDGLKVVVEDADLKRRWFLKDYQLDLSVPMTDAAANTLATNVLAKLKGAKRVLKWKMKARYNWQTDDKVTVNSTRMGISSVAYYVNQIEMDKYDMELELVEV